MQYNDMKLVLRLLNAKIVTFFGAKLNCFFSGDFFQGLIFKLTLGLAVSVEKRRSGKLT